MTANAISGIETASIQRRVREVIAGGPPLQIVSGFSGSFLTWLQPLYGIHGSAVDSHFKVERRRPGGCEAHPAHLCTSFDGLPLLEGSGEEIPVQRVAVAPMVEDDQGTEPRKRARKPDRPTMDGAHWHVFVRGDLDAVSRSTATQAIRRLPEEPDDAPLNGPVEGALKRSQWNGHGLCPCGLLSRERGDLLLKLPVGVLQFADILRGHVAPGVDLSNQFR